MSELAMVATVFMLAVFLGFGDHIVVLSNRRPVPAFLRDQLLPLLGASPWIFHHIQPVASLPQPCQVVSNAAGP